MSAVHPYTGEPLTVESLADTYLQALERDDAGLRWLLDQEAGKDATLLRVRDTVADEYFVRSAARAARTMVAAALFLGACAELPAERSWSVAYVPAGAVLRVELTGEIDRPQADETLQRRARELGCAAPTVAVATIAAKVEGEKTTTTVTGSFACGGAP